MKKLTVLSLTLSTALFALSANAKLGSPENVKYAGDLAYKNFCEAIVKDDVNMLKRSVRNKVGVLASSSQAVLKKLTADNGVACNGVDLKSFSQQRQASRVSEYLSSSQ